MDTPPVTLDPDEQRRLYVLTELLAGHLSTIEAALTLELSIRHLKRLKARYRREGIAALAHGNRGRRPWHAIDPALAERVVELARTRYVGLNHSHLADLLAEREGIILERSTIRRLLLRAGSPSPRPRRPPAHRSRRERMAREGVMLQADGSRHRWFGPDEPFATLIGAVDDATGTIPAALFREHEDAAGYLAMLRAIAEGPGIPLALYVDRHGIFTKRASERLSLEEELTGTRLPTQVGRALEELGIRQIHALSPQAKGRIERMWATIQGRLVAELRIEGITTIAAANAYPAGFPRPARRPLRCAGRGARDRLSASPGRARPRAGLLLQVRAARGGRQHDPVRRPRPAARSGRRTAEPRADQGRGPRTARRQPARPVAGRVGRYGRGSGGRFEAPRTVRIAHPDRPPRPGRLGSDHRPSGTRERVPR